MRLLVPPPQGPPCGAWAARAECAVRGQTARDCRLPNSVDDAHQLTSRGVARACAARTQWRRARPGACAAPHVRHGRSVPIGMMSGETVDAAAAGTSGSKTRPEAKAKAQGDNKDGGAFGKLSRAEMVKLLTKSAKEVRGGATPAPIECSGGAQRGAAPARTTLLSGLSRTAVACACVLPCCSVHHVAGGWL